MLYDNPPETTARVGGDLARSLSIGTPLPPGALQDAKHMKIHEIFRKFKPEDLVVLNTYLLARPSKRGT